METYNQEELSYAELLDKLTKSEHKRNYQVSRIHSLQREVMTLNHLLVAERNKVEIMFKKQASGLMKDTIKQLEEHIEHQEKLIENYRQKDKVKNHLINQVKDKIDAQNLKFRQDLNLKLVSLENETRRARMQEEKLINDKQALEDIINQLNL